MIAAAARSVVLSGNGNAPRSTGRSQHSGGTIVSDKPIVLLRALLVNTLTA